MAPLLKHGLSRTRLYHIWQTARNRCHNPNTPAYKNYGSRGIFMCDEWRNNFLSFYKWANNNWYEEHLTIERIDNDGPYSPENCRWATSFEQANNKQRSKYLTYKGETKTLISWARFLNINETVIWRRLYVYCWSIEKTFETPVAHPSKKRTKEVTFNGESKSMAEWGRVTGIRGDVIAERLRRGWSIERALTTPLRIIPEENKKYITFRGETLEICQWARRINMDYSTLETRIRVGWDVERAILTPPYKNNSKKENDNGRCTST
jgi:hypothetical protein